ncbi:hypothetical protein [Cytobacillus oceanisediminis]|uniref:hypothetical protein n=1 Tax=Cytobacillus oceanisediminis TaxID=665099 RepID=UPI0037350A60
MNKDNVENGQAEAEKDLKNRNAEGVLEISSTGYGLESVSKEENRTSENNPDNQSGCGGL